MHVEICPSINVSGEFFGPEITKTPSSFKISNILSKKKPVFR